MNLTVKRIAVQVGTFALGAGMIAANGVFMLTQRQPHITHTAPVRQLSEDTESETQVETITVPQSGAEEQAVKTVTAIELPEGNGSSKALLSDYTMLLGEEGEQESLLIFSSTAESFDVSYELDSTDIYDPQPEALNFTETRSVANEYYTVNDIISSRRVTLNAHELLCRAVYSEIGSEWDEDAIKAQVVAAYTYLRFNDAAGLVPTVGLKEDYPEKIERCVSEVEGQAVYYDGEIIDAVYSASTAGYSTESKRIWGSDLPYLRAVVSEYDNEDPNYGIESTFTAAKVKSLLESELSITLSDDLENWFSLQDIYSGRYVGSVLIDGQTTVTARQMESIFGLKSQAFGISYSDGKFVFTTYGWGHGVGMSQWGACGYANHGYTYDQILRHYYLNTTLGLSNENSKAVKRGEDYLKNPDSEEYTATVTDLDTDDTGTVDDESADSVSSDTADTTDSTVDTSDSDTDGYTADNTTADSGDDSSSDYDYSADTADSTATTDSTADVTADGVSDGSTEDTDSTADTSATADSAYTADWYSDSSDDSYANGTSGDS